MIRQLVVIAIIISVNSLIQKAYTILNPKHSDLSTFGLNDNTSHVMIGTYLREQRNADTLDAIESAWMFGVDLQNVFDGKTRYHRIFGNQENYDELLAIQPQLIATSINNNYETRVPGSFAVVDWDYEMSEEEDVQIRTIGWIQRLLVAVPNTVLKIPAYWLCKDIGGAPFFKHINHTSYILEMHGENNKYETYQSIFSQEYYGDEENGYSPQCPKNPSTLKLKEILNTTSFNIEKTLNPNREGFVGEMDSWIDQASKNNLFEGIVFFDHHPRNA